MGMGTSAGLGAAAQRMEDHLQLASVVFPALLLVHLEKNWVARAQGVDGTQECWAWARAQALLGMGEWWCWA